MSLKNFEQWVVSQNLQHRKVIVRLDRLAAKLGYQGPPMIYQSYFKLASIISLYWMISFPIFFVVTFGLLLRDFSWVKDVFAEDHIVLLLVGSSIFFGASMAFFIKREAAKLKLPPWKEFSDKKDTAA